MGSHLIQIRGAKRKESLVPRPPRVGTRALGLEHSEIGPSGGKVNRSGELVCVVNSDDPYSRHIELVCIVNID